MPIQQLMLGSTPGAEKKYIDDYFSTYLYTGNASYPRTITNNIDFSGTGGLLIQKSRMHGTFLF